MNNLRKGLWLNVIIWFVLGDMITTFYGLSNSSLQEIGPIAVEWLSMAGLWGLVVIKTGFTIFAYQVYIILEKHTDVGMGIPIGLSAIGIYATLWNLYVISVATHVIP